MKKTMPIIFLAAMCLCACKATIKPAAVETLTPGWYQWADQSDLPHPPPEMSSYNTSARCLCENGFKVSYSDDRKTFVVATAPDGFSDTVGHTFKAKEIDCSNCAD